MKLLTLLLSRRRLILTMPVLLALTGVLAWETMPRQEDPRLPERWAFLTVPFPGAPVEDVERLVLDPIEKALAEIDEIVRIESTVRVGVAISEIELAGDINEPDRTWDRVRRVLERTRNDLPKGVGPFDLNDDVVTPESIVLAVTGDTDLLDLTEIAERLKRDLLADPDVKRIRIVGDPGEQVVVQLDDAVARRVALNHRTLAVQLANRNTDQPTGSLRISDKAVSLRLPTEFRSIAEIEDTPLLLSTGASVPLQSVAHVRRLPQEPPVGAMRFNGVASIGLAISPKKSIDIVRFGESIRARVDRLRKDLPNLSINEAMFQPDRVAARISHLGRTLAMGIAIVAAVLFATMGIRMGFVVITIIPLTTLSSLAIYAASGGILHQLSIAALVISLGLVVDNAIVVAENVKRQIDQGIEAGAAARQSVRELVIPLAAATGTTLAAFVPMYLSKGNTADFVRAIPIVVMMSLTVSYLFAMLVTPVLSQILLRRSETRRSWFTIDLSGRLAGASVKHPRLILLAGGIAIILCVVSASRVEQQLFPAAHRNQTIVTLELPESAHISASDCAASQLEKALLEIDYVRSVTTFVGHAAPLFYYNINRHPRSSHFAQLVVSTMDYPSLAPVISFIREVVGREIPEATLSVRKLEQGTPVDAPIEIRLYGQTLSALQTAAETVLASLRDIPGTVDVHHDLGLGTPVLNFQINDAVAARYDISRRDIALALLSRSNGFAVGQYRAGMNPVPVVIRSSEGEEFPVSQLAAIDIPSGSGMPVPLAQLGRLGIEWKPGAIHHRNRRLMTTVASHLEEGVTSDSILRQFRRGSHHLNLPEGTEIEFGGEAEGSRSANVELFRYVPVGILLLFFCLLAEFNSFRRMGIILITAPLAAVGIIPGLILSGQPFGFMSTLGVLALVGIVVNNAIVLLDVVERLRGEGATIDQALIGAVRLRIRSILLTTITTIAGLLPLALSGTELWPPMAWAMISGLSASTLLTLMVVPALYRLVFSDPQAAGA
jgi:multidrug efflux pump subunit AcrB